MRHISSEYDNFKSGKVLLSECRHHTSIINEKVCFDICSQMQMNGWILMFGILTRYELT